jgi:hypothetical protein
MIIGYTKHVSAKTQLYLDNRVYMFKRVTCFDLYTGHFQDRNNSKNPHRGRQCISSSFD